MLLNTPTSIPDMNNDGVVDLLDVPYFVNVVMGTDTTAFRVARADMNCDWVLDGRDIQMFVNLIAP